MLDRFAQIRPESGLTRRTDFVQKRVPFTKVLRD